MDTAKLSAITNENELRAYVDQVEFTDLRKMGDWLGFPPNENVFTLKNKVVDAFLAMVELMDVAEITENHRRLYAHVPAGYSDLLDWRDQSLVRLGKESPEMIQALSHWQLSLF